MKILQIHNDRKLFGGVDRVAMNGQELLRSNGHDAILFEKRTDEVVSYGLAQSMFFIPNTLHHRRNLAEPQTFIRRKWLDVAHVRNLSSARCVFSERRVLR